jgi:hypothetical protein
MKTPFDIFTSGLSDKEFEQHVDVVGELIKKINVKLGDLRKGTLGSEAFIEVRIDKDTTQSQLLEVVVKFRENWDVEYGINNTRDVFIRVGIKGR